MRTARSVAVVGAVAPALAACGNSTPNSSDAAAAYVDGKTFTMVVPADPGDLDPHFTSRSITYQADMFLYDPLLNQAADGKLTGGLAEKWEGDTTTAKYTLRQGITCGDGTPLTASDVAANINFVGDPANKSSRIGVFIPPMAVAKADDAARTVTVTSPTADAFLVQNVGGLHIVCAKGMKDRSLLKTGSDGTGMFTLTESVAGDHCHDLEAAKSALDAAGWKVGADGFRSKDGKRLTVTLYYMVKYGTPAQSGAELAQKMWSSIGVDATVNGGTDAQIGTTILGGQGEWTAAFIPFGVSLPSQIAAFLSGPTPAKGGNNFAAIANPVYDAGIAKAMTMAGEAGCGEWAAAESALFKRADVLPFVNTVDTTFVNGATFELAAGTLLPTSIRMLA